MKNYSDIFDKMESVGGMVSICDKDRTTIINMPYDDVYYIVNQLDEFVRNNTDHLMPLTLSDNSVVDMMFYSMGDKIYIINPDYETKINFCINGIETELWECIHTFINN